MIDNNQVKEAFGKRLNKLFQTLHPKVSMPALVHYQPLETIRILFVFESAIHNQNHSKRIGPD